MLSRRDFLITSLGASTLLALPAPAQRATRRFDAAERLRGLEVGPARLGVCLLDTTTGEVSGNRIEERFAMCSSFKLAMVAACLREADHGRLSLEETAALFRGRSSTLGAGHPKASRRRGAEYRHSGASGSGNERWRRGQPSG
jgi:beta-lactamase class A